MYEIFENARDNQEIFEAYSNLQNYKVLNFDRQGEYCYIFFTSHGLFFPTTISEFKKEVVEKDKFEWMNIGSEQKLQEKAAKQISVSYLMNKIFTKYSSMSAPVKASLWFVFAVLFSVL